YRPFGDCGDVCGQPTNRSRLVVRLPTPLFVRGPLQHLAGVLHFLIKLGQQRLSNAHELLRVRRSDSSGTKYRRIKSEMSRPFFLSPSISPLLLLRTPPVFKSYPHLLTSCEDRVRKRKIHAWLTNSLPLTSRIPSRSFASTSVWQSAPWNNAR